VTTAAQDTDLATLRRALADAIAYRTPDSGCCHDCDREQGPCGDHRDDADRAGAYQALLTRYQTGRDTGREAGQ
jgi:hypothetical protein